MKELIILGSGPSRELCGYHCEVWGCNFTYYFARRLDKLFFTDEEIEIEAWNYKLLKNLRALHPTFVFPVVYRKFKDFGLPIELYPLSDVVKRFRCGYFSSSIAYMIAMALLQGYTKLWLYGIEYPSHNFEEVQERAGTEYWIGRANGMGIDLCVPSGYGLCETWNGRMYGEYGTTKQARPEFEKSIYRKVKWEVTQKRYPGWSIYEPGEVLELPSARLIEVVEGKYGKRAARTKGEL